MGVQNQLATSGWKAMKFKAKHGSRQAILVQFMPTIMGMSMTRVQTNQRILKINSEVASEFLKTGQVGLTQRSILYTHCNLGSWVFGFEPKATMMGRLQN